MFHIRRPIVLWQAFVINCKANTNACLAFLCKVIWGGCFSAKTVPASGISERLASALMTSPWEPASEGCLGLSLSDTAAHCNCTVPVTSPGTAGPKRISQKGWWGKLLKHSLKKPVALLDSSHISLHSSGRQSFLIGEIQARKLAFNSFFSCNLQFIWFPGTPVLEQA